MYVITVVFSVYQENMEEFSTLVKKQAEDSESESRVLHRGIAERGFERRFHLADHVKVTSASLENGLLHVDLVREVPEALKPRMIQIATGTPKSTIEAQAA